MHQQPPTATIRALTDHRSAFREVLLQRCRQGDSTKPVWLPGKKPQRHRALAERLQTVAAALDACELPTLEGDRSTGRSSNTTTATASKRHVASCGSLPTV